MRNERHTQLKYLYIFDEAQEHRYAPHVQTYEDCELKLIVSSQVVHIQHSAAVMHPEVWQHSKWPVRIQKNMMTWAI